MASSDRSCPTDKGEPIGGTYLGSLTLPHWDAGSWWWRYRVHAYYQARDGGAIWEQVQGGKAKLVTDVHPLMCPSPLAAVQFSPPPPPEPVSTQLFGKNPRSEIVRATAPLDFRALDTEPGSRFAAFSPDKICVYIHYQRPEPQSIREQKEILEVQYANIPDGWNTDPPPCKTHVLVTNAAHAQPVAGTMGKISFWPIAFRNKIQNGYSNKIGAALGDRFPFWHERWTAYHGDDGHLWFAQTWDVGDPCTEPYTYTEPVTTVPPDTIYVEPPIPGRPESRSPLAIVEVDKRVVIYYLNRQGRIQRVIQTRGVWEDPVEIHCTDPRRGTNLSAVVDVDIFPSCPWEQTVTISYQDSRGKIGFSRDVISIWFLD